MSLDRYPTCPAQYRAAPSPELLETYEDFGMTPPAEILLNPHEVDTYEPNIQDNGTVFRGLRDIADPLARVATRCVLETLKKAEINYPFIYTLPYEITNGLLYNTSFGGRKTPDSDGRVRNIPPKNTSPKARDARVDEYLHHSEHPEAYKNAYDAHKARGFEDDFIGLCDYRIRESKKHVSGSLEKAFKGRYAEFVATKPDLGNNATGLPEALIMPIGAYGEAFARKLLLATRATMEFMNRSAEVDALAAQSAEQNKKLLAENTARGANEYALTGTVTGDAVKAAQLEGVLSVMQALAWLTAEKVSGYENPDDLINDVIDQGLVEKLTRKVTMGTIGPTTVMGIHPEQALTNTNGELDLSEDLLEILAARKEVSTTEALDGLIARYNHQKWSNNTTEDEIYLASMSHITGIICPAAGKNGGVRQSADALKAVYSQLN